MEIIEGNKLIAEFMGLKYDNCWYRSENDLPINPITCSIGKSVHEEQMCYHNSWDWLMRVVEKIESLTHETLKLYNLVSVRRFKHVGYYWSISGIADYGDNKTTITTITLNHDDNKDIDALYNTVVKFIEWYNEKNK